MSLKTLDQISINEAPTEYVDKLCEILCERGGDCPTFTKNAIIRLVGISGFEELLKHNRIELCFDSPGIERTTLLEFNVDGPINVLF